MTTPIIFTDFANTYNIPYIYIYKSKTGNGYCDHSNWTMDKITEHNQNKNRNINNSGGLFSYFYKHTPYTVLDIDDETKSVEEIHDIANTIFGLLPPYTLSRTKKRPHYIIQIDDLPKYSNEVDIFIPCKGDLIHYKKNIWETPNSKVYNHEKGIPIFKWDDIQQHFNIKKMNISSNPDTDYASSSKCLINDDNESNTSETIAEKYDTYDDFNMDIKNRYSNEDIKKAITIINTDGLLNKERYANYDDWMKLLWACRGISPSLRNPLMNFCSKVPKWDETEFNKKWNERNKRDTRSYGLKQLIKFATEDNLELYETLFSTNDNWYSDKKIQFEEQYGFLEKEGQYYWIYTDTYGNKSVHTYSKDSFNDKIAKDFTHPNPPTKNWRFLEVWKKDPNRKITIEITYDLDPNFNNPNVTNLFNGFPIQSIKLDNSIDITRELKVIDTWLDVLSNHCPNMKHYIKSFIAHKVQRPHILIPKCFIFYSQEEGSGKSTFGEFMKHLFSGNTNNPLLVYGSYGFDPLFERFNAHLMKLLFYIAEEVDFGASSKYMERIKDNITKSHITFEFKGGASITIPNTIQKIITSNNENCMKMTNDTRRFVAINIANNLVKNKVFWDDFYSIIQNPIIMRRVYQYYMDMDISSWDYTNNPITEYQIQLIEDNISPYTVFITENYSYFNTFEDKEFIPTSEIYKQFSKWANENKYQIPTFVSFSRKIAKDVIASKFLTVKKTKTSMGYVFDKEGFEKYFNQDDENENIVQKKCIIEVDEPITVLENIVKKIETNLDEPLQIALAIHKQFSADAENVVPTMSARDKKRLNMRAFQNTK